MLLTKNKLLKDLSYIKIGGIAETIAYPETINEIKDLVKENNEYIVIGNCTNILFRDEEVLTKLLISLKEINKITQISNNRIIVQAGTKFSQLIAHCRNFDLSGLEELAGIPGTIGGLTAMNGGAHGVEIFDLIEYVEFINNVGKLEKKLKKDIDYSYRYSEFLRDGIVVNICLKLSKNFQWEKTIKFLEYRNKKQPLEYPNLGSIFKNPENDYAARLIEEAGLKGYSIGGAMISKKHANFIINFDNASYKDIIDMIKTVKKRVYNKFNINLETEIKIIER